MQFVNFAVLMKATSHVWNVLCTFLIEIISYIWLLKSSAKWTVKVQQKICFLNHVIKSQAKVWFIVKTPITVYLKTCGTKWSWMNSAEIRNAEVLAVGGAYRNTFWRGYFSFKAENLWQLWILGTRDLNFCIHGIPTHLPWSRRCIHISVQTEPIPKSVWMLTPRLVEQTIEERILRLQLRTAEKR